MGLLSFLRRGKKPQPPPPAEERPENPTPQQLAEAMFREADRKAGIKRPSGEGKVRD